MAAPSGALCALVSSPLPIPDRGQGKSSTFREEVVSPQDVPIGLRFSGLSPESEAPFLKICGVGLGNLGDETPSQDPLVRTADIRSGLGEPAVSGPRWEAAAESSLSHLGQELMGSAGVFNKK